MSLCPAFYCSRCKVEHPDECPPGAGTDPSFPAVGSRWRRYLLSISGVWHPGALHTVESVDVERGQVVCRQELRNGVTYSPRTYSVKLWGENPVGSKFRPPELDANEKEIA